MVDEEVESILREIRERVQAEPPLKTSGKDAAVTGNGAGNQTALEELESGAATADVALIGSYLTTTARSWDRLPPLISNRSGSLARLELWVKQRLKTATRWFTWEQVNFNAAVHHALRDTLDALLDHGRALEKLRAEIRAESDERRLALEKYEFEADRLRKAVEAQGSAIDAQRVAIDAQRAEIETQIGATETRQLSALATQRAEIDGQIVASETQQRIGLEAQRVTSEAKRIQAEARLMEQMAELDRRLQDEQRICFKQLSLEASETAVLEESTRRKVEASLKELTRRIKELEDR